jgi:WD40 repeat protein
VACTDLDGRPVAVTSGRDHTVRVWDLTSGTPIGLFPGHTGPVTAVACAQLDGRPIAVSGSWDHTVRIWDLRTRLPIDRIDLPSDVKAVTATSTGGIVAAFGGDIVLLERSGDR